MKIGQILYTRIRLYPEEIPGVPQGFKIQEAHLRCDNLADRVMIELIGSVEDGTEK